MSRKSERPAALEVTPPFEGRVRAVIDTVLPVVDAGRFAVKRIAGEPFEVAAHCFTDGHDVLRVRLVWWAEGNGIEHEIPMRALGNDVWTATFTPPSPGRYHYTVAAWVDHFESWRSELARRVELADVRLALLGGVLEIEGAAARARGADQAALRGWAKRLGSSAAEASNDVATLKALALNPADAELAARYPDRSLAVRYPIALPLVADRERARFSTWYEMFPRSASAQAGQHGTFKDVARRLKAIAAMGFDVLYFPPIHPIGFTQRKGRNNALVAAPGDVGSPWAIGAASGGHKSILPELGTPEDFRELLSSARELGIEIALDLAFQCSPDHPYVKAHPDWFRIRPDGSVQYAENPPKKYQDIYPFNFETDDWRSLWDELRSVIDHWVREGVRIFRVDNPHTKPFPFWEWAIEETRRTHPDVLYLAEAFTRPKVMHRLAKLGFSQSYTYFTWRQTKEELTEYFTELTTGPGRDYYRPNVWPNTPDILHEQFHDGEPSTFMARLVLAATLSSSYGIYGPAFELEDHLPREPGSEEYLNSEKYELRVWNHDRAESLAPFITRVNRIRRANRALQADESLRFLSIDNDQLVAYLKSSPDGVNIIVTVVNLDPHNVQSGTLILDPEEVGVKPEQRFQMHDLLSDQRFLWQGSKHFIQIDPHRAPAHIMVVRRRGRNEQDFDYFL
ncbi:MAG: alpha-1,4-glucan--maltose-1-phosphate maltosyltransferase [Vicinamibacteria bacterium]